MSDYLNRSTPSSFVKSALVLVSGAAFSQIVMIAALPILTRIYAPDDFSILAIYMAIVAIISVAACFGFDMAVPMPSKDIDAAYLLFMALLCSSGVSLITAVVLSVNNFSWVSSPAFVSLKPYFWMVPLGVWLSSSFSAIQFYAVRQKKFSQISTARLGQAVVGVAVQGGGGFAGLTPVGLLVGQLISSGCGVFYLFRKSISRRMTVQETLCALRFSRVRELFVEYRRFPQYSTFESLANSAGQQLPIIVIATLVVGAEAGHLVLAMRVMQTPLSLIGGAVGQVYLSRAPEYQRDGLLADFTLSVLTGLIKVGVGPIIFLGIVAPGFFELVFGSSWGRAGVLVAWMTPWFLLQYLASPISMVMHIQSQQRPMLVLTIFGLVVRAVALIAAGLIAPKWMSEAYAVSGAVFYFVCLFVFIRHAQVKTPCFSKAALKNLLVITGWIGLGLLINALSGWWHLVWLI